MLVPPEDELILRATISDLLGDRDLRRSLASRAREAVFGLTTTSWTDEYLAMIERL